MKWIPLLSKASRKEAARAVGRLRKQNGGFKYRVVVETDPNLGRRFVIWQSKK